MRPATTVTAVLASLIATALAQDAGNYDPINDFCRRFSHQTAVVGNRLYIDGGQLNLANRGGENFTNTRLLFQDLTTTMLGSTDTTMPVLRTNLSKPAQVPSLIGGTLWPDQANAKIYMYGGEYPVGRPDDFYLWEYDIYADEWNKMNADSSISRLSYGASTAIEYNGFGYYLGGYIKQQNNPDWQGPDFAVNTLLAYDFVHNQWTNRSQPADGLGRAEGSMFYVPVGDGGLLVYFGGVRAPKGNVSRSTPAPMNQMDIYDVRNQKWYQQNATGDIPETRRRFCGGIADAQDSSSFNVYIYGGLGFGENSTGYDDVYILSMPSFIWTKVYPEGTYNRSAAFPHYDLSCNVVHEGQMLIIGGQFPEDPDAKNCDIPSAVGTHNLNLGKDDPDKSFWATYQTNLMTYSVPMDISNIIGGGPDGAATTDTPEVGWSHPDLKVLFGRTFTAPAREATRAVPPEFGGPSNSTSSSLPTKTKVAIAVPVAVVGTAVLIGAIVFFLRRKHKNPAPSPTVEPKHDPAAALHPLHTDSNYGGSHTTGSAYGGSTIYPDSPPHSPSPSYQAHQMPNLAEHYYQQPHMWNNQYSDMSNQGHRPFDFPSASQQRVNSPVELPDGEGQKEMKEVRR